MIVGQEYDAFDVVLERLDVNAVTAVGDLHRRGVEHIRRHPRAAFELRIVGRAIVLRGQLTAVLRQQPGILPGVRAPADSLTPDPEDTVCRSFRFLAFFAANRHHQPRMRITPEHTGNLSVELDEVLREIELWTIVRAVMRERHQREQPRSHQYPDSSAYPPCIHHVSTLELFEHRF